MRARGSGADGGRCDDEAVARDWRDGGGGKEDGEKGGDGRGGGHHFSVRVSVDGVIARGPGSECVGVFVVYECMSIYVHLYISSSEYTKPPVDDSGGLYRGYLPESFLPSILLIHSSTTFLLETYLVRVLYIS